MSARGFGPVSENPMAIPSLSRLGAVQKHSLCNPLKEERKRWINWAPAHVMGFAAHPHAARQRVGIGRPYDRRSQKDVIIGLAQLQESHTVPEGLQTNPIVIELSMPLCWFSLGACVAPT